MTEGWHGNISREEQEQAGIVSSDGGLPEDFEGGVRERLRERVRVLEGAFAVPHDQRHPEIQYPIAASADDWHELVAPAGGWKEGEEAAHACADYAGLLGAAYARVSDSTVRRQIDYLYTKMQDGGVHVPVYSQFEEGRVSHPFMLYRDSEEPVDERILYLLGKLLEAGVRPGFARDEVAFVHDIPLFERMLYALGDHAKGASLPFELRPLYEAVSAHGAPYLETVIAALDRHKEIVASPAYVDCVGSAQLDSSPLRYANTQPYLFEELLQPSDGTFDHSLRVTQHLRSIEGYSAAWHDRGLPEVVQFATLLEKYDPPLPVAEELTRFVQDNNLLDATPSEILLYMVHAPDALPLDEDDKRWYRTKERVGQAYAREQLPGLSELCERFGLAEDEKLPGSTLLWDMVDDVHRKTWPLRYLIEHGEMQDAIAATFDVRSLEQLADIVQRVLARRTDESFVLQVRAVEGLYRSELGDAYAGVRGVQFLRSEKDFDHAFLNWLRRIHQELGVNIVDAVESAPYEGEGVLKNWRTWYDHPHDFVLAKEYGLFAAENGVRRIPCADMLKDPDTASFVQRFGQLPILQGAAQGLAVPSDMPGRLAPWVANPEYLDTLIEQGVVSSTLTPRDLWEQLMSAALLTIAQDEGYRSFVEEHNLVHSVCRTTAAHENAYAWYQDELARNVASRLGLLQVGQHSMLPEHETCAFIRTLSPEQVEEIGAILAIESAQGFVRAHIPEIAIAVLGGRPAALAAFALMVEEGFFDTRDDMAGFPVSKENLVAHLDDKPLFDVPADATYPGEPKPWTRDWFAEDRDRLRYLTKEIVDTVQTFGTVVGLALYEKADDVDAFRGHYEDVVEHMTRESERRTVLQLGEMFSIAIRKGNYDFFDSFCEKQPPVSETLHSFAKTYEVGSKGETLLTLLFAAAVNTARQTQTDAGIDAVVGSVYERVVRYQEVLERYDQETIPEGLRVSVGMEYEVTKSIAEAYAQRTASDYKTDIETLSCYSGIARGSDAVHEIATEPTDNPYALLLEMKLLEELDFVDLNFKHDGYERGSRSYHITYGGETGIECDQYAHMIQNSILMVDLGGISAGEEVQLLNHYANIRQRVRNNRAVFAGNNRSVEYRSLSIDRAEPFERAVTSMFDLHIAKQALDRYTVIDPGWIENVPAEALADLEVFKEQCERDGVVQQEIADKRVWNIISSFVRYQRELVDAMKDHAHFFQEETLVGSVPNEVGQLAKGWVAGGKQSKVLFVQHYKMALASLVSLAERGALEEDQWFDAIGDAVRDTAPLSDRERRMMYLWYKKFIEEPVQHAGQRGYRDELRRYATLLDQPNGSDEIARRVRNTDAFASVLRSMGVDEERFMRSTTFVPPEDLYGHTDAALVNKMTRIHNLYLKPPTQESLSADTVNALAVFETTREEGGVAVTDGDASMRTAFDTVDRGLVQRNGPYVIQGSGENMVANRAQRALLAFTDDIRTIFRAA